jgi:hypothetical protein
MVIGRITVIGADPPAVAFYGKRQGIAGNGNGPALRIQDFHMEQSPLLTVGI